MILVKFYGVNWWGNKVYKSKAGLNVVKLPEGFYTLTDNDDIDSEPYRKIKDDNIKIVDD